MIVIDAAAFIDAVDGRRSVLDRLMNEDIHAPHLLDVEVLSGLRRLVATGRFNPELAAEALSILEQADIARHPHTPLLRVAWSLRGQVSAYDAAYVALAAALDAPLVTTDRKLAGLPGLPCAVEGLSGGTSREVCPKPTGTGCPPGHTANAEPSDGSTAGVSV